MSQQTELDILVLGGGPGGLAAAQEAAAQGMRAALVEKADLGGACLNWGCIPTKLFLGATSPSVEMESPLRLKLARMIPPDARIEFDLSALQQRKERMLAGSRQAVAKQLTEAGVELIAGEGRLHGPGELLVDGKDGQRRLTWRTLILATGSRPASLPHIEADGRVVLNSNHALALDRLPARLIVVGAGAIGMEMADFFSRMGVAITLVEGLDRLAPTEDPEVGQVLAQACKRRGWTVRVGQKVAAARPVDGAVSLTLESGDELLADQILLATGRRPNSQDLGLETAGIRLAGPGWIQTDENLLAAPGIYAIGDINGRTLLAHAAAHQARYAVRHAAGHVTGPYACHAMPFCMYGEMEALRVGNTAAELLKEDVAAVETSRSQLAANPIAQSHGAVHGFIKVVWAHDVVRGITAVGHGVSHLAAIATVAVAQGWTREQASSIVWAHPTLDEALEAALCAPRASIKRN